MRQFLGEFTRGPFHGHPNYMEKAGDETELHEHRYDHLVCCAKPIRVQGTLQDGTPYDETYPPLSFPVIAANVRHKIIAVEDDTTFVCLFSTWQPDENGAPMYATDPKVAP